MTVTATLANAIKNNRVAHAYIFSGARGVGKTTACGQSHELREGPDSQPCGECDSCKEIAAGTSLDVIEIDVTSTAASTKSANLVLIERASAANLRKKIEHGIEARARKPGCCAERVSLNEAGDDVRAFLCGKLIHRSSMLARACMVKQFGKNDAQVV